MRLSKGLLLAAVISAALPAFAGRLEFGDPQVEGDKVTIPVMLTGDLGPGVSSIDFSMRYDAAALTPVNAGAGTASAAADKQVHAHARSEGDYKVVIVGLNSNSLQNGEVATIVMQKNEGTSADSVNMRIVETTFASPDAVQVPSQGDSQTMNLDGSGNSDDETEDEETPAEETPDNDNDGDSTGSDNETPGDTNNDAESPSDGGPAPIASDGNSTSYPNEGSTPPVMTADAGQSPAGASAADGAAPKAAPGQPGAQRMNQAVAAADAVRTTLPTPAAGASGAGATENDGASAAAADGSPAPASSGDAMVLAQDTTSAQSGALAGAAGDAPSAVSPGGPSSDTMVKLSTEGGPEAAQTETAASSGGNSTVLIVVAGVVLAGIVGLVLLRNRLFA